MGATASTLTPRCWRISRGQLQAGNTVGPRGDDQAMNDDVTVAGATAEIEPPPTGPSMRGVPKTTTPRRRVNQTRLPWVADLLSPWRYRGDNGGRGGSADADAGSRSELLQHPARARGAGTSAPTEGSATPGSDAGTRGDPSAPASACSPSTRSATPRRKPDVQPRT